MTQEQTVAVLHTACTLDCPDTCSLQVTVTNGRITNVDAAPGNPLTDGWICAKVKRHAKRVYAPERVMTPLIRSGPKGSGEFVAASWSEAIELISGKIVSAIDQGGRDSVVAFTYNSSAGQVESHSLTEAYFAAIGATAVEHTICAHTMGLAWESVYGTMTSADPFDVVHSKLVIVWGANPTVSNTHFPPLVQQAVEAGASVVVIDPRRTAMAKRADLHLAIRPGTDVVLAQAIASYWSANGLIDHEFADCYGAGVDEFLAAASARSINEAAQICGLDIADIATLSEWWATTKPAMLRIGWGQERNANGGAACRSILALPVLIGQFRALGSGVIGSTGSTVASPRARWPIFDVLPRRSVDLHQVGRWMAPDAGDACRVLFVQGANPVVMCPDQHSVVAAFKRDDVFTVVHDQVLTDTALYADIVLPATTAFEISDVVTSYGSNTVQPVRPVIDRVGESRSNDEVGQALANALGLNWEPGDINMVVADAGPRVVPSPRQFEDSFPPGDRAALVDPQHGPPTFQPLTATLPLTLISPASSKLINSMFGEFQSPSPAVTMHPFDARTRNLSAGQQVVVFNDIGSVATELQITEDTRPGVVVMSKGVWLRHHTDGWGVNALTPASGDPLGNGACFNDALVDVRPA